MNKIYKVIFNHTRGMYQVVSEIAKSVSSKKSETTKIKNACLALLILLAVGGTGNMYTSYAAEPSGSTTATAPENQDIALLKRLLQELQDKQAAQSNIIQTQEGQIQAHSTALNAYDQSLRNFEISLQANKDAITDITKTGGKLDQTIAQVNTVLDATGQGMQRLQDKQNANSGAIAQLKTSVADITKKDGTLDKAIQNAVQKLTSTGGAVDTNKNAIAKNAGEIKANKTQIGKNTEQIGKNTSAISKNAQALATLNGPDGTIAKIKKDVQTNSEQIGKNKEQIGNNAKAIEDITKKGGTLDKAKQALSNEISSAKTDLEGKIKKAQEDIGQTNKALEGRVKTNEGNIASNKGQINKNTKAIEDITKPNGTLDKAKQALSNEISNAKNDLQGKINTTNQNLNKAKTDLFHKIDTTKSALEKTIGDNKKAANNALTTVKNDLQGKIDTTNQNLNNAKRDLGNTINSTKAALSGQISGVQRTLQGKIDATNRTVATNQQKTDDNFKKIEEFLKKRVTGQQAGQKNLGLDFSENAPLGLRYFRTSLDSKSDAHPDGTNSLAIGMSTTKGEGSIGIAALGGVDDVIPAEPLKVEGAASIGIGNGVTIEGKENPNTIAIGTAAKILDKSEGAIAIGEQASIVSTNKYAIAIGAESQTYAEETMALGHSAKSYMTGSLAIGQDAKVGEYIDPPVLDGDTKIDGLGSGIDGIAIGHGAQSMSDATISIGNQAGFGMKKTGTIPLAASHIIIGNQAGQAMEGLENIALGYKSGGNVQSNYNISIGSEAGRNILGSRTDPIGKNVSIGYHANFRKAVTQPKQDEPEPVPGTTEDPEKQKEPKMKIPRIAEDSEAIKLVQSTAIGSETLAANNGTAVGYQAQALGNASAAYGFAAIAEGECSVAFGNGAKAQAGNVAIGSGSVAAKQDIAGKSAPFTKASPTATVVSVGNEASGVLRRVTNVGDAVDSHDAVTLGQLQAGIQQAVADINVKAQGDAFKSGIHYDPALIGGVPSITLQPGDEKTGTVIHNVAKGVNAGDAVNLAQLKEYTEKGMGHYFSTYAPIPKSNFANEGATGENSVAFGIGAAATDKYSAAMGNYVQAQGEGSLAIGTGYFNKDDKPTKEGTGEEVQPVMTKAYSGYRYNVAIGPGAQSEGNYAMAIGPRALTKEKAFKNLQDNTGVDYALSIGYLSTVYGKDGIAIGHLAEAHQAEGIALGHESWSLRDNAMAIGTHNTALGKHSGAVGMNNGVSGNDTYVIGNNNMNLADDDREGVLDSIAKPLTKGIPDNDSTVFGNRNTMTSKFKKYTGLDGETEYQGIDRGQDNHIVGNENTLTETNDSFVTGSTNELVGTTSTFLVGSGNKVTNNNTFSGILGATNTITGNNTTTLGNENKISGDSVKTLGEGNEVSGSNLAVIGNTNTEISGNGANVFGNENKQVAGEGSNVFGNANTGVTTENGHVIGFSNKAIAGTNQQVLGSFNDTITGKKTHVIGFTNTNVSGEDQRVIGNENNNITGKRNTVLGNKNKEVTAAAEDTQLIGNENVSISAVQAQILGNSNTKISTKSGHVLGNMNSIIGGEKLSVIGDENSNVAGTQSLLFGYKNNQVEGVTVNAQIMGNANSKIAANRTQIIGNANEVRIIKNITEQGTEGQDIPKEVSEAVKDAQVMGNNNKVHNDYVQVLGNHITTTLDKSVYLGDNAAYNEDETLSAANKEYTKDSIYGYAFAGTKPVGVVTVGAKGNERRLQNVAAGLVAATSTDAVNGSQLYQLTRPLHFAGDDSTWGENDDHEKDKNVLHRGSNQNITIKGGADVTKLSDNNIGVAVDPAQNTMNVKLAKNLTDLETITFGKDGTSMKIDGTNQSISNIKKVTFGAPDSQGSLVVDGENKIISGLSNTTWTPKDKRDDATFDRTQAATQGQLADFEKSTQRGFDVYVNKDEADNKFTVQLGDEKKNDAFGFLAGNNLTVSQKDKQITYALKDDLAVGKEGQDGKDGSLTVHGKEGETVAINGKDGNVTIESAKDGESKKNTITMNGKDGTVGIKGKDGATVVMNGDGTIVAKGKGEDGKPGASVTIDGKNGITTIEGKTDDNNQKNTITLNGKDGKMGVTGKDGSNVTLNGQDGSIGMNGKNGTNAVSITTQNGTVGVDGQDGTTRLVVKEGTKVHELATMSDGMKFMGDAGTEDKLKLNEQLTVTGGITDTTQLSQDNNIGVIADGKKALTLRLAKNIQGLDTITLGDAEAPMKIDGTTKTISRIKKMVFGVADSTDSLIMDGEKKIITGLSNKTLPTDLKELKDDQAASQGQLKEVLSKIGKNIDDSADYRLVQDETATDKKYSVKDDGEVVLTVQDIKHPKNKDTVTIKDVAKKSDLDKADTKFEEYAVKYDKTPENKVNKNSITLEGDKTTGTVITNVGVGKVTQDSKDAVNGSQLYKTNKGFDVYIKDNTDTNKFNVGLGADEKDAFGFDAGNGLAITRDGKKITYSLQDDVSVGKAGDNGKDGKITVNGKDGEKVTINGKNGEIGIQGPKGADGKTNTVTISGKDGTIGTNGKDGSAVVLNGQNGSIGMNGKDGKNGVTISSGDGTVGVDGKDGTTRIIVTEGNHVNELATMNDGLKFMGDSGTAVGVKLNNQVNIVGGLVAEKEGNKVTNLTDNNIGVESVVDDQNNKNAKLVVRLAKNLSDLESITFDSKDKTTPMKIDGNAKTISNVNKITGLTNTTWPAKDQRGTDFDVSKAATQGQIQDVENAVDEKLKKSNQGFDILVGEDTADHRANIALGQDKKETVEFAAGNSLDVTLDKDNKKVIYSLKDDIEVGKEGQPGQPGKDGKVTVNGKDGEKVTIDGKDGKIESKAKDGTTVTVNGKDGTIGAQGPKGADGKDGTSVTINGKDGTTIINGATDENGKKNVIALDGKDGKMGITGKDGNSVTLNGQDGSIDIKGKDGTNKVQITTKDGKVGVDGKDGETRIVVKEGTKTHELATMNDGMQFAGDIGNENKLKLNQKLTVTGGISDSTKLSQDNNIGVIADGTSTLTLRLAKAIKGLDSITLGTGDTAMKIDGAAKTISNVSTITGLTNTTLPTDLKDLKADQAASQGQLRALAEKVQTNANAMSDYRLIGNEAETDKKYSVTDHNEIVLTVQDKKHPAKKEMVTIKDVAKKSELDTANKTFTDYAVKYDKNGDTVNKNSITLEGGDAGTVIKNVANGKVAADSKEAINGSQLHEVKNDLTNEINTTNQNVTNITNNLDKTNKGFDVYIKDKTTDNTFNVGLGADEKDAFGFDAGNGLAITRDGKKITYSLQDDVSVGKAGDNGKDGKITVNGKDGEKVTINGKNGEIGIQGPKGADGKTNTVTISGKDGTIGVQGPKGADGQDGNSVTLNGKDGSIGIKGKDGKNKVDITTGNGKVGLDGNDGETRIIVKDGTKNNELATMNDGLKFMGDSGTVTGVKLNNQVNIVGGVAAVRKGNKVTNLTDNNIGVESMADNENGKNAKLVVRLAKNLSDLESITFDSKDKTTPMKIDGNAKTIENIKKMIFGASNSTDSVTIDGEKKVITGLSNTTLPDNLSTMQADQAASQGQLKQVLDKATSTDGSSVKYDKNTDGSVNKNSITLGGDTNGTVIKNVKAGDLSKDSKEAVNGSQLYKTNQNVTNITNNLAKTNEGFDILVGEDTADNRANVALGKNNKETVEFAAGNSLEVTLDKNAKKVTYSLKDDITVGKDGEAGKDGKITVNGKDGEKVTIDGKDGKIESKAKDGTTVTVNGKDGTIGAQGPKGADGKDGASVTINGKDGTTIINGATDENGKKNTITLNGKDGTMGVDGKDGNGVTLNGQDGSIGIKGKDGTNKVQITTRDGKVGVDGKDGETRIVVKEGTKTHELATMNDGMQFAGDIGNENKLKLNQKLTVTGGITDNAKLSQDDNIGVIADGTSKLTIRLAKEIKGLDSITFGTGDTAMKIDGTQKTINNITKMTFKTSDNKDSIVVDGTNKVITGLSNTTLPTDGTPMKADQAASQGQLKQVLDKANDTDKFAVKYDKNTDGSVDKNSITLGGDTNGTVIKNVKGGDISENSKEAVNGSQLYKTNQGFDILVGEDTEANRANVALGQEKKETVKFDAGKNLSASLDKATKKVSYRLNDEIELGEAKTADKPGVNGKITIHGTTGEKMTLDGKNGEVIVETTDENGKKNEVFLKSHDGTMGVTGKENNGVTLHGEGFVQIKGAGSDKAIDLTTEKGQVGVDGQGSSTRLLMKEGNIPHALATMDDGLKFMGDSGTAVGVKLNNQINIVGGVQAEKESDVVKNLTDNNIGVESIVDDQNGKNAKMKIRLAKKLSDMESITFNSQDKTNPMTIDGVGRTIKDLTTMTFLKDGKNNFITGLSNITWPAKDKRGTDFDASKAATQGQIQDVENAVDEKLKKNNAGFDVYIKEKTTENTFNIALGKDKKEAFGFLAGNGLEITRNGKEITYAMKDDITLGKKNSAGKDDGKDGKFAVTGKDGNSVTVDGKDGKLTLASATDDKGKKNQIALNGKDGSVRGDGKSGNAFEMNADAGTVGAKGADGSAVVLNGKDGTIDMNGKDGKNKVTIGTQEGKVGIDGTDGTTRVVVKEGDKVNELATMNDGLKFKGDSGDVVNRKLNETLSIEGGADTSKLSEKNIGVVTDATNGKMSVKLAKDLKDLTSVETKDDQGNTTNMTGAGTTTTDNKGNTTATTATGMTNTDAAGHVTNTTASGVVAKDQDKNETSLTATGTVVKDKDEHETSTTATGVITKDKDGNQTTVSAAGVTTEDKDKNTNVSTAKDITVSDKDGNKTVINKDGMTITSAGQNAISLTKDGLNNGGKTITGVATGVNDTDAVNVKQLKDEIEKNSTKLEGSENIAVSGSGKKDDPFKVALKDDITLGKKNSEGKDDGRNGKFVVTGKDGNSVTVDGTDGQLTLAGAADKNGKKNQISLNGKDGTVRGDSKSGNAFEMNADTGTVGAKGADGSAVVLNGKDGTIDMNGKDGKNKVTIGTQEGKVGIDGTDGTTRVVVKEGDKVNELATMNDGLKFKGDSGDVVNRKLNETLSIEGGADTSKLSEKNIGVVTDAANGKMSVKLAKDLKDLTSVETKDDQGNTTNMTGAGTTTTDTKGNTTTTNATGVTTTDGKGNKTTTTVDGVTTADKDGNSTSINKGGITIQAKGKNTVSLTDKGLDNGGNKLTSIADGEISKDSKEAVNGSQLYKTNQGFDVLVGEDTPKNRANVALGKDKKETVEFAAGNGLIATIDKDTKKITYAMKDTIEIGKKGEKDGKLVVNGKDGESITMNGKDGIVETKGTDGTTVTMNGKDGTVGAKGTDGTTVTMNGKDGTIGGKGADGTTVTMNAKDGTIGAQGPKGADGKDGASVIINGKDGTTTINGATDKDGKKNTISLNGKDGKMGVTGKDGNSVTLNGQDGSIGMKGKDGKNTVQITTKDGKVGLDGKDGETRIVVKDGDKVNELATMKDGMKFAGDSGDVVNRKLNDTLTIEGGVKEATKLSDGNIGVVTDKANGKMTLKLAKELKNLDRVETKVLKAETIETESMTMGDVTLNKTGLTIKNGPAVTKEGINAGGKAIHNVKSGVIAANSQDAVNGSQLFGTEMRIAEIGGRVNQVGAGAAALAGLHPLDFDPDDKWDFAASYGKYSGNNAFALGAYYRPNESTMISVGGTLGDGNNMLNVGLSMKLGQGNNVTNSRVAMAKEIIDLRKENKALKSRLDDMENKMNKIFDKLDISDSERYVPTMYPDTEKNHWAYEYINELRNRKILFNTVKKEYTRMEMAQMIYAALKKGAAVDDTMDRALSEFENEIRGIRDSRIRVDRLHENGNYNDRVRVNPEYDTKQTQDFVQ